MSFESIKKALDESFGTPTEGIKTIRSILTGDTGKRIDSLLGRIERLSANSESLPQVIELLKLVKELDDNGTLARVETMMKKLPSGRSGAVILTEIRSIADILETKVDKLSDLATKILGA